MKTPCAAGDRQAYAKRSLAQTPDRAALLQHQDRPGRPERCARSRLAQARPLAPLRAGAHAAARGQQQDITLNPPAGAAPRRQAAAGAKPAAPPAALLLHSWRLAQFGVILTPFDAPPSCRQPRPQQQERAPAPPAALAGRGVARRGGSAAEPAAEPGLEVDLAALADYSAHLPTR